jgi:hypothetical protein
MEGHAPEERLVDSLLAGEDRGSGASSGKGERMIALGNSIASGKWSSFEIGSCCNQDGHGIGVADGDGCAIGMY